MSLVNSFTEWGKLEEVIIGDCLNFEYDVHDPTFQMVYYDNIKGQIFQKSRQYKIDKNRFDQRIADLDRYAKTLEDLGITVRRPKPLKKAIPFKTPWFSATCSAPDSVRDIAACIGNKIIEVPITLRSRYFESTHLHDIFYEYFRSGAEWINAPKPTMSLTRKDDTRWTMYSKFHSIEDINPKMEILFDSANFIKLGVDIIINVGDQNAELGAFWLERILGKEFRVHRVRICDSHIDGTVAPLKPGVMWYNPVYEEKNDIISQFPKHIQKWDWIPLQEEDVSFCRDSEELFLATQEGMFINVLSISEDTIIIQDNALNNIRFLEKHGFNVIPLEFNQGRLFSGGFHCTSLDVRRNEVLEDYSK